MASPIGAGAEGSSGTGAGVLGDEERGAAAPGAVQKAKNASAKARRLTPEVYHFGGTDDERRKPIRGRRLW
jgi:hypothetical protein